MRTPLCELLGIQLPIIQGAIGGITTPELAAAVSGSGGLGTIAMTGRGGDGTKAALESYRDLSDKPVAANFILDYEIDHELAAALDFGVPLISLFWGDPAPYVERVHDSGAMMMMSVGSESEAGRAAEQGADVIVAQGWEAGGHVRGTTATLPLIPRVVDEVHPIPVVAAGGIADGRGLAAVLALGAQAAWIGSRFLLAQEANAHPLYQQAVLEAGADDTVLSTVFDEGWPDAAGRAIRNSTYRMWEKAGQPPRGRRPKQDDVIATDGDYQVRRYEAVAPRADYSGDIEAMPLWAGQGVGLILRRQPASEIVAEIAGEAEAVIAELRGA